MSILPHIQRYRELLHIRDTGKGLEMAEVLSLESLGTLLRNQAEVNASPTITAIVTSNKVVHKVELLSLGPEQLRCNGPRLLPGSTMGLRLDDESDDTSYLFRVAVTAAGYCPRSDTWNIDFAMIGRPVRLSWGRGRTQAPQAVLKLEKNFQAA